MSRFEVRNSLGYVTWHTSGGKHPPKPAVFATRKEAEKLASTMRKLNAMTDSTYDVVEVDDE